MWGSLITEKTWEMHAFELCLNKPSYVSDQSKNKSIRWDQTCIKQQFA